MLVDADTMHEIYWVVVCATLVAGYQAWLWWCVRRDPGYSVHGANCIVRKAWVKLIMSDASLGILGIQTLRNSVMAATLMASTTVLLSVGALSLASDPDRLVAAWPAYVGNSAHMPQVTVVKLLAVLTTLFTSFFFFAMAVRGFNHTGYLISVKASHAPVQAELERTATLLNRAGLYQNLGLRCFLLCIPLIFWLFGPRLMLAATVILVFALRRLDRAQHVPSDPSSMAPPHDKLEAP